MEAITFLNTCLRTFDGKTFFVPNRKILDDIMINYHSTESRQARIDVNICYDQNLVKTKQVLEAVMIEDPRVQPKSAPVVYVLDLADSCIKVGGRCWVSNEDYWAARCDLLEKDQTALRPKGH